jgi:hypothetical protein
MTWNERPKMTTVVLTMPEAHVTKMMAELRMLLLEEEAISTELHTLLFDLHEKLRSRQVVS